VPLFFAHSEAGLATEEQDSRVDAASKCLVASTGMHFKIVSK
jgi:hypothetical protein